ncbi:restriction endonuclease subunit S [bacterium]|nr:restriction endonuclease subunit S [bacterium]
MRLNQYSESSAQPGLSVSKLVSLNVAFPSTLAEQEAIAEALSDADALIESLEQLIAKKRQIKQGAMQELLTGKKRLPGFSGEWEVKRPGELGSTFGGLTGKTKIDFGQGSAKYIPFLNVINNVVIKLNQLESVSVHLGENQNLAVKGDLFFNGSSETPEEVGMCAVLLDDVEDVYLNSFCFGFRLHLDAPVDGLYLAYFFRSVVGRKLLYALAQGATRHNLSKTALMALRFGLPTPDEQTAIATILSDMDAEIAALEAKLTKARQLKQGMMQELLTGRIRLI